MELIELTILGQPVTITAIYPDDGPMGSLTFNTATDSARGAVFLTSQNGVPVEEVTEDDITAAIEAVL
jgi:hypothetical protein